MGIVLLILCLSEVEYLSSAFTKSVLVVILTLVLFWFVKFLQIFKYNVLLIVCYINHNILTGNYTVRV